MDYKAAYEAVAHALGCEYAPDTGPTHPGDLQSILDEIRSLQAYQATVIDQQVARRHRRRKKLLHAKDPVDT